MKTPARRGKGTLRLLCWLLILSGTIRLTETGQAWAQSEGAAPPAVQNNAIDDPAPDPFAEVSDNPNLLAAFQKREARLAEREAALAERLKTLEQLEADAAERLAQSEAAEVALRATMALADVAAENDVAKLVAVYENMKPKEAAALFTQMTPEFAAGFLGLMAPPTAALIMAQVSPETAYSISVVLAGRNLGVPIQEME